MYCLTKGSQGCNTLDSIDEMRARRGLSVLDPTVIGSGTGSLERAFGFKIQ